MKRDLVGLGGYCRARYGGVDGGWWRKKKKIRISIGASLTPQFIGKEDSNISITHTQWKSLGIYFEYWSSNNHLGESVLNIASCS